MRFFTDHGNPLIEISNGSNGQDYNLWQRGQLGGRRGCIIVASVDEGCNCIGQAVAHTPAERRVTLAAPLSKPCKCDNWDIAGSWSLVQAGTLTIPITINQSGTNFTGKAQWASAPSGGSINGALRGSELRMRISWGIVNGKQLQGDYFGTVTDSRIVNGTATPVGGGNSVTWTASGQAICRDWN
jgi:hypothetical protein